MPKIYAVASVKGGVGKTTTAANLAATLAAAGYDTVAVDADLGSASLAPSLGIEPGEVTIHDVLAGEAEPSEALCEGPHGLAVLPGGSTLDDFRKADPGELVDVLESITGVDFVIVDTGAGLTHETALPLSVADGVLLVSTPTRDGLANTRKTQDLTDRLGGTVVGLALTHAEGDEDTGDIDVPVLGTIPEDPLVAESHAEGSPLAVYAPDSDPAAAYRSLASSLTGEPIRPAATPERSEAVPDDPAYDATENAETDDGGETASDLLASDGTESDSPSESGEAETTDRLDDLDLEAAVGREAGAGADADIDGDAAVGGETETGPDAEPEEAAEAEEAAEPEESAEAEGDGQAAADADAEAAAAVEAGSKADAEAEGDGAVDGEADADAVADAVANADVDADDEPDEDDAVILDDEADEPSEEDRAAAAARSTVLREDEYDQYRDGPATVADAESGDTAEIGEDVIPFAQQSKERTEEAKQSQDDDEESDESDDGGFFGRLFR